MSVLVVGSIAYDTVETPFGKVDDSLGGSALYFSAAASLFGPVNVVGVIGSDFDTSKISFLENRHVNFDGMYVDSGKTFRWGGRYHKHMNIRDTLFTYLNVFENFKPQIPEQYRQTEYVFLANIAPELQMEVLDQIKKPKLVVLDTMNFWINGKRQALEEVIKRSDILILNDEEAMDLTDEPGIVSAAHAIIKKGIKTLVIKKGEHGAVLIHEDKFFFCPAYPLSRVVDPTGAGDGFAGGFVGYLAQQKDHSIDSLKRAVVYGSAIASFIVEDFSFNRLIKLKKEDLEYRFEEFGVMTRFL